jgi:signal transduction histidine kinase
LPTRSALFLLFALLVAVPVAAAIYLGSAGLERERAMLVETERQAMARRADELRDDLVARLQDLFRREWARPVTEYRKSASTPLAQNDLRSPTHDYFEIAPEGKVALPWGEAGEIPADIRDFAQGETVRMMFLSGVEAQGLQEWILPVSGLGGGGGGQSDILRVYGTPPVLQDDLEARSVLSNGRVQLVQGFRVDVARIESRFLDALSPLSVVPRMDERLESARLVPEAQRLPNPPVGRHGLPNLYYRFVLATGRDDDPVLLPRGYLLEIGMHPAAALGGQLAAADDRLVWTLGAVGFVVLLGLLFAWRAVRAESRLATRKAEFVSAVSHELRTPLTSIRMYADMLKEGWVKDEQTAKDYFGLISAESERLTRLVNNVLDFSRIEKGRKDFEMRLGDPAPVVRDVAGVLAPYLREKGFELQLEVPERLPECAFDKDALTQILVNLIDNAVKYGAREVRVEAEAIDGRVVLRVLDRGPGIPAEEQGRIFEPFSRGENAGSVGGSGLGLALVHHYVDAHGGRIEVGDREGGGAVFALSLPAA